MASKSIAMTKSTMQGIGLKHVAAVLSDLIQEAEIHNYTYREFLDRIMDHELEKRNEKRKRRNLSGAHFPPNPKPIDEFDTAELDSGITPTQIMQLKDLAWIDSCTNILFLGPPGLGKTMLAVGLGLLAIDEGYTVCFERMSSLMKLIEQERSSRKAAFRLRRINKCQVLIIDEIGFLPITRDQANAFFTLVSNLYEKTSIIITSNKDVGEWAELLGDPVLATALLDRFLFNARGFSLKGQSYRMKHQL
jgi:DNA replication protein DnaC